MNHGLSKVRLEILEYLNQYRIGDDDLWNWSRCPRSELIDNLGNRVNKQIYDMIYRGDVEEIRKDRIYYRLTMCGYHYMKWRQLRNE